jgi:hypothetical protein
MLNDSVDVSLCDTRGRKLREILNAEEASVGGLGSLDRSYRLGDEVALND